jgi:hypothetical protein
MIKYDKKHERLTIKNKGGDFAAINGTLYKMHQGKLEIGNPRSIEDLLVIKIFKQLEDNAIDLSRGSYSNGKDDD